MAATLGGVADFHKHRVRLLNHAVVLGRESHGLQERAQGLLGHPQRRRAQHRRSVPDPRRPSREASGRLVDDGS